MTNGACVPVGSGDVVEVAGGTTYPSTPPKVDHGRRAGPGNDVQRLLPSAPNGPGSGVTAVSSVAAHVRRRGCLCRLPDRTVTCHSRLGTPPSLCEGRGDRGGKRARLRGAEATRPGSPGPGAGTQGRRAGHLGRGGRVSWDGCPGYRAPEGIPVAGAA